MNFDSLRRVSDGVGLYPGSERGGNWYLGVANYIRDRTPANTGHFVYIPPGVAVRILLLILRHGEQPLAGPLLAAASRFEYLRMVYNRLAN